METKTIYEIKESNWPERAFIAIRKKLGFDKLSGFFTEHYGAMYPALTKAGVAATEAPFAIYYEIDEKNGQTDVAAAVPVNLNAPAIGGYEKIVLPASKIVSVVDKGPYDGMMPAYAAMDEYLASHNLKRRLILEQYLSDPVVDTDKSQWKTEIFYVVE